MEALKKIYIAGPMRGYKKLNFPIFFDIEELLKNTWKVVSPARISIALWIQRGIIKNEDEWEKCIEFTSEDEKKYRLSIKEYLRADFLNLICCDAICLLPGWKNSEGANKELQIARLLDLEVYDFDINNQKTWLIDHSE